MSRPLIFVVCIFIVASGCKDKATQAVPVVPDDQSNGPPDMKGKSGPTTQNDDAVNLSPYMIRGEITVPHGCKIHRRLGAGSCVLDAGPGFSIEIEPGVIPLAATKEKWSSLNPRWIKDEPNLLMAELQGIAPGMYAFEARITLGDQTYRLLSPVAVPITNEQAERMVRSALSLKQTDEIKASVAREPGVIAALKAAGCELRDGTYGRSLVIKGDNVSDDQLVNLNDIGGLNSITLNRAPRLTAAGITRLASVRGISRLALIRSGISDQLAASFKTLSSVQALEADEPNLSDAGVAFMAGMPGLEEVIIRTNKGSHVNGAGLSFAKDLKGLKRVTIVGESFDDTALENLGEIRSIRELTLERARITDGGLRYFENLKNLESLNIHDAPIRGSGLAAVTSLAKLKRISLHGCPISDAGVDRLRGSEVEELDLSQTGVGDVGLKLMGDLSSLKVLDVRGTKVTDAGLAHLGRAKGLSDLNLSGTNVTGSGLSHLKAKPDLEKLAFDDTLIGDDALAELAGCPNLVYLSLNETAISDAGLDKLQAVKNLRTVSATGTEITRTGVERLKKAIKGISVEWTSPSDEPDPKPVLPPVAIEKLPPPDPASLVKKYDAQVKTEGDSKDKPVIAVSFEGKPVTDEEIANLRAWKSIRVLNLKGCEKITDAALPYIALLPELTDLNLIGTAVKGDGLVHLKSLVELANLDLPAVPMTAKQVAPLAPLKELEKLHAKLPLETDVALKFLTEFPKLKQLDLRGLNLSNRQMVYVGRMRGLERLDLSSERMGDRGLAQIKNLKKLQELRLINTAVTDAGLKSLGEMSGLKVLELSGSRLTDVGMVNLRLLTDLERLKIANTGLSDRSLVSIRECSRLIELELRGADITDKGLASLAEMKDIEWIDLSGTRVTDEGLKHMRGWEELRKLTIEDSSITGTGFAALKKLKRLARIQLNRSRINDQGIEAITQLTEPDDLYIWLDGTPITDAGLEKLASLQNLRELSLNGALRLTDKAADILKKFPSLTEVSVRGSAISPKAIAELKKKEGLTVNAD